MRFLDDHHIVRGFIHQDVNGSPSSDIVSLKNWSHCAIVLEFANTVAGGDADITILACNNVAGSQTAAINNFTMRKSPATTVDDLFAAAVTVTDSKIDYVAGGEIVPDVDDNVVVVIDVDASQVLGAGASYVYDCLKIAIGSAGQSTFCGCLFILSGPRHAAGTMASAIID